MEKQTLSVRGRLPRSVQSQLCCGLALTLGAPPLAPLLAFQVVYGSPTFNRGQRSESARPHIFAAVHPKERKPDAGSGLTGVHANRLDTKEAGPGDSGEGAAPEEGVPFRSLPPLTRAQARRLREISARNDGQNDRVFSKLGDSMTVHRAFLRCFAAEEIGWGPFSNLASTAEHFRQGGVGGRNPYLRESEAAGVGWSVRSALIGRPSPLQRELRAARPRFATVMFGTNDIESRSPRRFAERFWSLLEQLEDRGVVPIVSTIPPQHPRRGRTEMVARYNLIIRALTEGRDLPLHDLHEDFLRLPRFGVSGDGYHATVYSQAGVARPCDFSQQGLAFGSNVRNIRTLQRLDQALGVLRGAHGSMVSAQAPVMLSRDISAGPLADGPALALPHASVQRVAGNPTAEVVVDVVLREPRRLWVIAIAKRGGPVGLRATSFDGRVVGRAHTEFEATLPAGAYRFVLDREDSAVEDEVLLAALTSEQRSAQR